MTCAGFLARYLHQTITAPGGLGGECVDAANQYLISVLGLPPVRANAVDWAAAAVSKSVFLPNQPTNSPATGDIVVWGPSPPVGIGANGHIAVVIVADVMHLLSADQNWNGVHALEIAVHSYRGVLGWWHPLEPHTA